MNHLVKYFPRMFVEFVIPTKTMRLLQIVVIHFVMIVVVSCQSVQHAGYQLIQVV
jgi:hypothetical protein